jgi:uncharacterized protein (DUF302 family)
MRQSSLLFQFFFNSSGDPMQPHRLTFFAACALLALGTATPVHAGGLPGTQALDSSHEFEALVTKLETAVADHKMAVVAKASASQAAAARGVKIPGNAVIMVFRNDYAVRMLEASIPAGIEAPLRFYVTENPDGQTRLSWRTPSATFAPYGNASLDEMAHELDAVFTAIARDAVR